MNRPTERRHDPDVPSTAHAGVSSSTGRSRAIPVLAPNPHPGRMYATRQRPLPLDVGRERVATHAELVAAGVPISTVTYRIAPGGRWQRLLPGVVLMHNGRPTTRERMLGGLAYAGPEAVITGATALSLYALRTAPPGPVHVLVPHERRRQNHDFVVVERTRSLPDPSELREIRGLPVVPLSRAVVDACRRLEALNDVRNLVSDAVQNHGLTLESLHRSLHAAARARTALMRRVADEVAVGVRFAAEARARELVRDAGLPEPLYNVQLLDDEGDVIAEPDGYYDEWVCGYQIDSRRWHMSPEDYEHTVSLRAYAGRFGVLLVPVTPRRVFEEPTKFIDDVWGVIRTAQQRTPPVIRHRIRTGR